MSFSLCRPGSNGHRSHFCLNFFSVSNNPSIISFAGGLPSTSLIDTEGIAQATRQSWKRMPGSRSQYQQLTDTCRCGSILADRYRTRLGLPATADEIQIVNGSQQCLDLFAKIFLNTGDHVGMERPGYLGAIEAFSLYEPVIDTVPLEDDGPESCKFETVRQNNQCEILLWHSQLAEPVRKDLLAGETQGNRRDTPKE